MCARARGGTGTHAAAMASFNAAFIGVGYPYPDRGAVGEIMPRPSPAVGRLALLLLAIAVMVAMVTARPAQCSVGECKGGRCEFVDCDAPSCRGGKCTFTNCQNPTCEGGLCKFFSCTNPTCAGGVCDFWDTNTTLDGDFCKGGRCNVDGFPHRTNFKSHLAY